MGLFKSKEEREASKAAFREKMAAQKAERDEKAAERKARHEARAAELGEQNELLKVATDPIATQAQREAATAQLVELIGEEKARRLIGARSRLQSRGWVR